jgi:hypothetical protein
MVADELGGAGVTVTVAVNGVPEGVPPVVPETAVVVAPRTNLVVQAVRRLATFTEPSPVAASYSGPAGNATLLLKKVTPSVVPLA